MRKTREALHSAFFALIVQRDYDAITVQDIIQEADVGRTTFYAHFKSKEEVLTSGFQRLRDDLHAAGRGPGETADWRFVELLLLHAKSHRGLYAALLCGPGGRLAENAFRAIIEEMVVREIGARDSDGLLVAMLSGAILGAVRVWLDAGAKQSVTDVAGAIRDFSVAGRQS